MDVEAAVELPELDNVMPGVPGLGPSSGVEHVGAPVSGPWEPVPLLFSKPPRRRWCGCRRGGGGGGGGQIQQSDWNMQMGHVMSTHLLDASYPMSQ